MVWGQRGYAVNHEKAKKSTSSLTNLHSKGRRVRHNPTTVHGIKTMYSLTSKRLRKESRKKSNRIRIGFENYPVYVRGYYRKDGTWVRPHYRNRYRIFRGFGVQLNGD